MAVVLAIVLALVASTQAAGHCKVVSVPTGCTINKDQKPCSVTCTYADAGAKIADGTITVNYDSCAADNTKVQAEFTASAKVDGTEATAEAATQDIADTDGELSAKDKDDTASWEVTFDAAANNQRVGTATAINKAGDKYEIGKITWEDYRGDMCNHGHFNAYFYLKFEVDDNKKRIAAPKAVSDAFAVAAGQIKDNTAFAGLDVKVMAAAGNQGFALMVEGHGTAKAKQATELKLDAVEKIFTDLIAGNADAKDYAEKNLKTSLTAPEAELYIGFEGAADLSTELKEKLTAYIKDELVDMEAEVGKFGGADAVKDFAVTLTSQSIDSFYKFSEEAGISAEDFSDKYLKPFVNGLTGDDKKAAEALKVTSVAPTEAPAANNTSSSAATASVVVSVVAAILAAL